LSLVEKTSGFSEMFWIFFLLQIWQILFKFRKSPKISKPQNEKQGKMQLDEKVKEFLNLLYSNYYVMVNYFKLHCIAASEGSLLWFQSNPPQHLPHRPTKSSCREIFSMRTIVTTLNHCHNINFISFT
jgi:hypothetical protein